MSARVHIELSGDRPLKFGSGLGVRSQHCLAVKRKCSCPSPGPTRREGPQGWDSLSLSGDRDGPFQLVPVAILGPVASR
jgi:hypothetical protein